MSESVKEECELDDDVSVLVVLLMTFSKRKRKMGTTWDQEERDIGDPS